MNSALELIDLAHKHRKSVAGLVSQVSNVINRWDQTKESEMEFVERNRQLFTDMSETTRALEKLEKEIFDIAEAQSHFHSVGFGMAYTKQFYDVEEVTKSTLIAEDVLCVEERLYWVAAGFIDGLNR